jgi:D-xylose 1-dehydrogenase (NADP+, D-xylono-1,5-lactone-forming)
MPDKLRWGILSTAGITEAIIFALNGAPRSELVAVASRDPEKGRHFAERAGIPIAHGSYDDLLADPDIDVVYVPLPNTLHAEWAIKAAQAGKHVLVEKPIVTTVEELDAIEAVARDNKVVIFEAFMSLHAPQNRQVVQMVRSGRIGELKLINSWFCYYLPPEDSANIRLNPHLAGGSFWDVGVYPNSLVISLAGGRAPERVWATQDTGETAVDVGLAAQMAAQMQFADGAVAQIYSGFRSPFVEGAQIIGTDGVIRLTKTWIPGMNTRSEYGPDTTIEFTDRDGQVEISAVASANPWQEEVEAMEACVLDGAQPVVPLSLSREFLRSALALKESARTGKVIDLEK